MKKILLLFAFASIVSCSTEDSNAPMELLHSEITGSSQYTEKKLQKLFIRMQTDYRKDPGSAKVYFDRMKLLSTLSADLRKLIRDKQKKLDAGERLTEDDWNELDKKFKVLKEKSLKNASNHEVHSSATYELVQEAFAHLYPGPGHLLKEAHSRSNAELKLYLPMLVNNLFHTELEVAQAIYKDMHGGRTPSLFSFSLAAVPEKAEVRAGMATNVHFHLVAVNAGSPPEFVVGKYDLKKDTITYIDNTARISVSKGGNAALSISDNRTGEHEIQVIAIVKDPATGKNIYVPHSYRYNVIP